MSKGTPGNEFSHLVQVDRIGPEGTDLHLVANPAEREALARRFRIPAVLSLSADLRVFPDPVLAGHYRLTGQLAAEVEQTCVVSLAPVRQQVAESVQRLFAPPEVVEKAAAVQTDDDEEAEWLDPDADDPPDPLVNGGIDAGAVVAEVLALALDPYPRKPGAGLPEGYRPDDDGGAKVSPFAVLAKLKTGKND